MKRDVLGAAAVFSSVDEHVCTGVRQRQCDRAADAARAAGHDGCLTFQYVCVVCHRFVPIAVWRKTLNSILTSTHSPGSRLVLCWCNLYDSIPIARLPAIPQ